MGFPVRVLIVSGSRADLGLLHCPQKALEADPYFTVELVQVWGLSFGVAFLAANDALDSFEPDMLLILGDRFEIMATATAAHLRRIPIAHIGGGDVTEGSYDDAMRDCISRMAAIHFATSTAATARLVAMGYRSVHLVGNPAVDYIMHEDWRHATRAVEGNYVVASYQAETIDDTVDLDAMRKAIGERRCIWISPNPDRGSERIPYGDTYSHDQFLNLLLHCDEFIGNSSAMLYEAPFLRPGGVPCTMVGKRQRGRCIPWGGEGKASERMRDVLRLWSG